jgi:hypothetical protein
MIRPELNGKLIILGYFGACPNVNIQLPRLDRPTPLTFLLSGHVDQGAGKLSIEIVESRSNIVIASTGDAPLLLDGNVGSINLAPTLLLTFGRAGEFVIRCVTDEGECYRSTFTVSQRLARAG